MLPYTIYFVVGSSQTMKKFDKVFAQYFLDFGEMKSFYTCLLRKISTLVFQGEVEFFSSLDFQFIHRSIKT